MDVRSPLVRRPTNNLFFKNIPDCHASEGEIRVWLATWLIRPSVEFNEAFEYIQWDGIRIRDLTENAMAYELADVFQFANVPGAVDTAKAVASDVYRARQIELKELQEKIHPNLALKIIALTFAFLAGYAYCAIWESGKDCHVADHALRVTVILLVVLICALEHR